MLKRRRPLGLPPHTYAGPITPKNGSGQNGVALKNGQIANETGYIVPLTDIRESTLQIAPALCARKLLAKPRSGLEGGE